MNGNICIWGANTGEEVLRLRALSKDSLCLSPAGNSLLRVLILSGLGDETVRMWEVMACIFPLLTVRLANLLEYGCHTRFDGCQGSRERCNTHDQRKQFIDAMQLIPSILQR